MTAGTSNDSKSLPPKGLRRAAVSGRVSRREADRNDEKTTTAARAFQVPESPPARPVPVGVRECHRMSGHGPEAAFMRFSVACPYQDMGGVEIRRRTEVIAKYRTVLANEAGAWCSPPQGREEGLPVVGFRCCKRPQVSTEDHSCFLAGNRERLGDVARGHVQLQGRSVP